MRHVSASSVAGGWRRAAPVAPGPACPLRAWLIAVVASAALAGGPAARLPVLWAAQPEPAHAPAAADSHAPAAQAEAHESGLLDVIARLFNFAVLAGVLGYFLRAPIATYLRDRSAQIRSDLVAAQATRDAAGRQLEEIDRKMQALPAELAALRERGHEEIEAERARIREVAETERRRLVEHARREIDLQLRVARRDLVRHAAELAVGVAATRIRQTFTSQDQLRLTDRYLGQLRRAE